MPTEKNKAYKEIKEHGLEAYRERVETKKRQIIESDLQKHLVPITFTIQGKLKRGFCNQVLRQGYVKADLCREIFKYYYETHPNGKNFY